MNAEPGSNGGRLLGLDLGGTNLKAAVTSLGTDADAPEIVFEDRTDTRAHAGPEAVAHRMVTLARAAIDGAGEVQALGVGVPGLFDYQTGEIVFFTNLPGRWEGFPLRSYLAEALGVPVTLINDARAFTLAEWAIGAGRGCRTLACLTLGTGVGGGLIVDGKLHFGAYGIGGEIGHQTVDPNGLRCGCGNRGCLEAMTRGSAIAASAGKRSFEDVLEGLQAEESASVQAVERAARHMAVGLANILTVIGPERIVIGGGLAEAGDLLLDPIREAVRQRVTLIPPERVQIVAAELGPIAGAVGASLAARGPLVGDGAFLIGEVPSAEMRRSELS